MFRPGKVKVGWSKDQRELWELGWGGDRIEVGRGRLWGTRAPLHLLVTFPAPLLRVSPHQKKSPHSEDPGVCLWARNTFRDPQKGCNFFQNQKKI